MGLFKKPSIRKDLTPSCTAVIAAGGTSSRMGGEDKLFCTLGGKPVILRTVEAFQSCENIDNIIIVTRPDSLEKISDLCSENGMTKVRAVVSGGDTRQKSVMAGLAALPRESALVAIHDGARPLVTEEIIRQAIIKATKYSAAAPAVKVTDTVKSVKDGVAGAAPDRESLRLVQTPQVFRREIILAALESAKAKGKEYTDETGAVEAIGGTVYLTEGSPRNLKITTPTDLLVAEAFLKEGGQ